MPATDRPAAAPTGPARTGPDDAPNGDRRAAPEPAAAPGRGPGPERATPERGAGERAAAPERAAEGRKAAGKAPARSATDSRETLISAVPRRLRRRYADEVADEPPAGAPGGTGVAAGPGNAADAGNPAGATVTGAPVTGAAAAGPTAAGATASSATAAGATTGSATAGGATEATGATPTRPDHRRWARIGAAAAAALVLVTTAFGFSARGQVYDGIRSAAALAPDSDAILDADTQAGDRNILVLGLQAERADAPESARSDTAVLVHQPAGGGQPVTLSVPATLEVARPPCDRWDAATGSYGDTVPAESRTAFATAYDVGGPACTVGVVQQLTGIPVTGVVALDLAGTPELVDAVGGIRVCTERPVVDPVLGPVVEGSGSVPLDGPLALRFAAAAATADSSPANRVQRQQRVLGAALGDALSTTSLLTPGAAGRAAEGVSAAIVADGVDAGEILTLARGLGRAGTAGDRSTPLFLGLPVSETPNTRGHLELQRSDARALFAALRKHEPLPESATAPAARSAAAPATAGTVVDLVDATGSPGSVDRIAENLRERGYEIGAVRTGDPAEGATVRYSPDRTDAAGTLVGVLPGAWPAPDPTGSGRLEIVVGATGTAPVQAVPADDADCY
ncbi:LCP family protein [Pseudonocardia sp. NPDC046786]|uniref:LCP family protein n=1 Tax=Pseudonocardia sp. NPDC046786 TaxID=3155471 RepID=UPI0034036A68